MRRAGMAVTLGAALWAGAAPAQISLLGLQNSLVQFALARISTPESFQITADGVQEGEDGRTELAGVRVSDARGVWLEVDAIGLGWSPARILRGELQINRLAARGVRVLRRPDPASVDVEAKQAAPERSVFSWPRAPLTTRIDEMRLDGVTVAPGVLAGQGLAFDALGAARDEGAEQALRLELRRTDAVAGRIDLDYLRDFRANTLRLTLAAEEAAGGVTAELAGFPTDSASRIRVDADGPLTDWAVTLAAEAERVFAAEGAATVDLGTPLAADARLTLRPFEAAPPEVVAALAPEGRLTLRAREGADGVVRIEQGEIRSPALTADAAGTWGRQDGALDFDLRMEARAGLADALADDVDFDAVRFEGRLDGRADDLRAVGIAGLDGLRTTPADVGAALLEVDVTAAGGRIGFDVKGFADRLRLDRLGPEAVGRAELAAAGFWDGGARVLALEALTLGSPLMDARAAGRADIGAGTAALDYAVEADDLAPVAAAYGVQAGGAAAVSGALSGALDAPRLVGAARATGLVHEGDAYGAVAIEHDAVLGAAPEGRVALKADGSRFGAAEIATRFRLAEGTLALSEMAADALGVQARGAVSVALESGLAEGEVTARIADLGPASRLAGSEASGSAEGLVRLSAAAGRQDASLDLTGAGLAAGGLRLDRFALDADVTDALGTAAAAEGKLSVAGLAGPGVAVATLEAEGRADDLRGSPGFAGTLRGTGLEAAGAAVASVEVRGEGADLTGAGAATLTVVARGIAYPGAQARVAEARFEGTARDFAGAPAAEGRLTARDAEAMGARVATLEAEGRGADLLAAPGGTLTATATGVAYPQAGARVETLRLEAEGADLTGAEGAATATLTAQGIAAAGVTARRLEARAAGRTLGSAPAGEATATLTGVGGAAETARVALEAALARVAGDRARLTATLAVDPAKAGGLSFGAARAEARVDDALGAAPAVDARATVAGADLGAATLDSLSATLKGPLSRLDLALDAGGEGRDGKPAQLALRARANAAAAPPTAEVSRLEAAFRGAEARLESPARLTLGASRTVQGLDLSLPGGRLTGEAGLHPDGLSADLRLAMRDLGPMSALAGTRLDTGSLDAEARIDTRPGRARGEARASARDLGFGIVGDGDGALDLDATAGWDGRRATVDAALRGPFPEPLTATAALPLRPTGGLLPAPPQGAPIEGGLRWRGRIGELWALVPAADHVLDGDARIDLRLSGPATAPDFAGEVALADGRYENLEYGTILTNLSVGSQIGADGSMQLIAQADDGAGRPVRARAALNDGAVDAQVVAERATLARRDDVTAEISLDIAARGPLAGPTVSGTATVERAEVRLVNATPPSVADLGEVRIKGEPPAPPRERAGAGVGLDLTLSAPRRIFVRGRGLDSEWNMNLRVTGTAAEPVVAGSIERVRGALLLAGFPFELNTGFIRFRGTTPVDPDLEIALLRENTGVTGGIWVRGPASKPEISFESRPPLPEGEVLPRVLFGRSQQSLTAGQGLQLAAGLAVLLQGSGGPLDAVRSTVGLDVLRVEDDQFGEGGASVTAGQNVADGVFVGARQPLDGGTARVVVEVEITPSITVDTEIGQEEGSSVGLNWRRDF
jgi:translocation and assembly module TamB